MIALKGNQIVFLEQDLDALEHLIVPVYDIAQLNQRVIFLIEARPFEALLKRLRRSVDIA
ncbi:hypothetical protein [Parapedobacter soli]|uniref:hypothetical protein n=1 Tax=Parapedobacter soli TaxID=416955 RepID=UPI0021C586A4|nr:hypothetical protein [Parapedobacter soli]